MSVSGNMAESAFPETVRMRRDHSTARVRRYRANRGSIRVEVEVPTPDDALAIKRFARQRRAAGTGAETAPPPGGAGEATDADHLTTIIADLPNDALAALDIFAKALADAGSADLIARAQRVAVTYQDAVARAGVGRTVLD